MQPVLRQRLSVLAIGGVLLFDQPILSAVGGWWGGWPTTFVYLFGVWAALLAVAAWLLEKDGI
jgi:hypothetical protein